MSSSIIPMISSCCWRIANSFPGNKGGFRVRVLQDRPDFWREMSWDEKTISQRTLFAFCRYGRVAAHPIIINDSSGGSTQRRMADGPGTGHRQKGYFLFPDLP